MPTGGEYGIRRSADSESDDHQHIKWNGVLRKTREERVRTVWSELFFALRFKAAISFAFCSSSNTADCAENLCFPQTCPVRDRRTARPPPHIPSGLLLHPRFDGFHFSSRTVYCTRRPSTVERGVCLRGMQTRKKIAPLFVVIDRRNCIDCAMGVHHGGALITGHSVWRLGRHAMRPDSLCRDS